MKRRTFMNAFGILAAAFIPSTSLITESPGASQPSVRSIVLSNGVYMPKDNQRKKRKMVRNNPSLLKKFGMKKR